MPEIYADLHLHTFYSDATISPKELMDMALKARVSCIAITDHDTVEALPEAFRQKPDGLELIAGIELSSDFNNREVHILGYFVDHNNEEFLKVLSQVKQQRIERICLMTEKLREIGLNVEAEEVFSRSGKGTVGRLHLARLLLEKGLISNISEAFVKYIGENAPAYVSRFRFNVFEAIDFIRSAGGTAVLAHPLNSPGDEFIRMLSKHNLSGLEVFYPEHNKSQVEHYLKLAQELGLVPTGGSDFHGEAKAHVKLGLPGVSYEAVVKLKEKRP